MTGGLGSGQAYDPHGMLWFRKLGLGRIQSDGAFLPLDLSRSSLFIEVVMALSFLRRLSRGHTATHPAQGCCFCCAWLRVRTCRNWIRWWNSIINVFMRDLEL